jgi:hypothetical protein
VLRFPDGIAWRTHRRSERAEFFAIVAENETMTSWQRVHVDYKRPFGNDLNDMIEFKAHAWLMGHNQNYTGL